MSFHRSKPVFIPRWQPPVEPIGKVTKKPAGMPQTNPSKYFPALPNPGTSPSVRERSDGTNPALVFNTANSLANEAAIAKANSDAELAKIYKTFLATVGQSGSGSGTGQSSSDKLAWAKWNDELNLRKLGLAGMESQLSSGAYRGNADALLALLASNDATSQQGINDQYARNMSNISETDRIGQSGINNQYTTGMSNISGGFGTARTLTDQGFTDANKYLNDNPNNPYQNLTTQNTPVQNAMSQLLASLGVSNDPVAQQVQAENVASQQSQGAADLLTGQLSANADRNDASRLSEMKMAQMLGNAGQDTQRAGYESQASNVQQQALTTLLGQINNAKFGASNTQQDALSTLLSQTNNNKFNIEQGVGNSKQTLINAIIAAGGNPAGLVAPPPPSGDTAITDLLRLLGGNFGMGMVM